MRLGLGTGSTAARFVAALGERVAEGLNVLCVPTSEATREQAEQLGIPLTTLDETPQLDLTVDGADEIDDQLRMIKGGGGALLREKIVATASDRMVVVADESKLVSALGAVPAAGRGGAFRTDGDHRLIEAIAAETGLPRRDHAPAGARATRRSSPTRAISSSIAPSARIPEPEVLAFSLKRVPGVVEHGLFLGLADLAIVAGKGGVTSVAPRGSLTPGGRVRLRSVRHRRGLRRGPRGAACRRARRRVGIAEEYRIGGTCVIRGCVPKKLLVYGSRYGSDFADARGFGWTCEGLRFDWPTLIGNVRREVDRLNGVYTRTLEKAGVDRFLTRATLAGPHEVKLADRDGALSAKTILIATGVAIPSSPTCRAREHLISSNECFRARAIARAASPSSAPAISAWSSPRSSPGSASP